MKQSGRKLVAHCVFLLLLGIALGALSNVLRPTLGNVAAGSAKPDSLLGAITNAIPWFTEWDHYIESMALKEGMLLISVEGTRKRVDEGLTIVLDARPLKEFDEGHIPGAISLPFDSVETDFEQIQFMLTPEQAILTYCSGSACEDSFLLTKFLNQQGYTNVVLFAGGFDQWKKQGHPVEGGS